MRYVIWILLCLTHLSHADGFLERLPMIGGAKQEVFLPPDQAFGLDVTVLNAHTLLASFRITPGYYLYRDKATFGIKGDSAKAAGTRIAGISMPKGEIKHDPNFGDMAVFHQPFQVEITLERTGGAAQGITLEASYQG
ncbi:MAG: protein-disulfide reductase DsbD N-terminal domain-containing protein, partial [Betaproteobacteria bacterium]|nr:protein-disulfide reductase DsbD N-terminal domain-containing protein [Betaproteobacteria bacterium]